MPAIALMKNQVRTPRITAPNLCHGARLVLVERVSHREPRATGLRSFAVLLAVVFLAGFSSAADQTASPARRSTALKSWSVRWQPARLVNGAPVVFRVTPPARLESLSGKWLEHDVFFNFDPSRKIWYGIAGISLETPSGIYTLELNGTTKQDKEISFQRKMAVRRAKYPSIAVTVAKQYTEPSPEQLERISQEKTLKQGLFSRVDPERE